MVNTPIKDRLHERLLGADSRQVRKVLLEYAMESNVDADQLGNPTPLAKALLSRLAKGSAAFEGLKPTNQSWLKSKAFESLIDIIKNQLRAGDNGAKSPLQKRIDDERQADAAYELSEDINDEEAQDDDEQPNRQSAPPVIGQSSNRVTRSGNPVQPASHRSSPAQAQIMAPEGTQRTRGDAQHGARNAEAQQITEMEYIVDDEDWSPEYPDPNDNYPFYTTLAYLAETTARMKKRTAAQKRDEKYHAKLMAKLKKVWDVDYDAGAI